MKKIIYSAWDQSAFNRAEDAWLTPPDYPDTNDEPDETDYAEVYIEYDTFTVDTDGDIHFDSEDSGGWPSWMKPDDNRDHEIQLEEHSDIYIDQENILDYIIELVQKSVKDKYGDQGLSNGEYSISNLDIEVEYIISGIYSRPSDDPEETGEMIYEDAKAELVKNPADEEAVATSIRKI